jgi:hypothetical protein
VSADNNREINVEIRIARQFDLSEYEDRDTPWNVRRWWNTMLVQDLERYVRAQYPSAEISVSSDYEEDSITYHDDNNDCFASFAAEAKFNDWIAENWECWVTDAYDIVMRRGRVTA